METLRPRQAAIVLVASAAFDPELGPEALPVMGNALGVELPQ